MDALLANAPSGVLDSLISVLVELSCAGLGLSVLIWFFGLAWEMVVGIFRDII